MAPNSRGNLSLYDDAKLGLRSLLKLIVQGYAVAFVILLITGGRFTPFSLSLLFCVGTGAVAWQERNRILRLRSSPERSPLDTTYGLLTSRTEAKVLTLEQLDEGVDYQVNHSLGVVPHQRKISREKSFTVEEFLKKFEIQPNAIELPSVEDVEIPVQELSNSIS